MLFMTLACSSLACFIDDGTPETATGTTASSDSGSSTSGSTGGSTGGSSSGGTTAGGSQSYGACLESSDCLGGEVCLLTEDEGHSVCGYLGCQLTVDCPAAPPGAVLECATIDIVNTACFLVCSEDTPCPEGMECVDSGIPICAWPLEDATETTGTTGSETTGAETTGTTASTSP